MSTSKRRSLRQQLLWSLMGTILGVSLLGSLATYLTTRNELDEVMDYHLRQLALSMRAPFPGAGQPMLGPDDSMFDMVVQVWDGEGLRLYLSRPHSSLPDQAQLGYSTVRTPEGEWRTYSVMLDNRVIQVAQPMTHRNRIAAAAAMRTLRPLLLIMPMIGIFIWFLVGRGLQPLEKLARAVNLREPESLSPLPDSGVPEEAKPLVHALNGLLNKLNHAMATQRAFVADAAHELRTPLTALQIQLQLTERADSDAARSSALNDLHTGLNRAIRVVQQLLTLARQEPGAKSTHDPTNVNLAELAGWVIADYQPLANEKNIDLGASQLEAGVYILGDRDALRTMLGNLIDNAIRYTPPGGKVDVGVHIQQENVCLEVIDNGPGIPVEERERVMDRFYRRAGQLQSGSGLGLSIVKAVVDRHKGNIRFEAPQSGGLSVKICFPNLSPRSDL